MGRGQQAPFRERSLLCFVQALQGMKVVIEMRNDVAVKGTLADVDDKMNLVIDNAVRLTPEGEKQKLETIYVRARVIRYVHFPPAVDPSKLIEKKRLEAYEAARFYQKQAAFGPHNPNQVVGCPPPPVHQSFFLFFVSTPTQVC
jgi:small nuclear ribonucleoprotein (snRNP)-like protein